MYSRLIKTILAAVIMGVVSSPLYAFVYDESVSGDLTRATSIFTLDSGANTVSGSMKFGAFGNKSGRFAGVAYDFDPFDFIVQTGMYVDSITVTITNLNLSGRNIVNLAAGYKLGLSGTGGLGWQLVDVLNNNGTAASMFSSVGALSAGTYSMAHRMLGLAATRLAPGFNGANWNYNIAMNVTAVSETTSLFLFMAGLLGFVALRKRV